MYNGYTESPEKIAARKARILKGYKRSSPADQPRKRTKTTTKKATGGQQAARI